jgi:uncharacterized NAD-dependent epimerase/dehydratase family protein
VIGRRKPRDRDEVGHVSSDAVVSELRDLIGDTRIWQQKVAEKAGVQLIDVREEGARDAGQRT